MTASTSSEWQAPDQAAWERIKPLRASDEIVRQIREAVFCGRLRAGDPVGSEKHLSAQFGVSRTTVRDAMRTLEASGLIEIRTGAKGGALIAQGDPLRFADILAIQLQLVGVDRADVLAAQMGLESVAAELAATKAEPDDLAKLANILEVSAQPMTPDVYRERNYAFHEAIALASHNWAIITTLRAIHSVLRDPPLPSSNYKPDLPALLVRTHQAIFDAIRTGDGPQAADLMRQHISKTRGAVLQEFPTGRVGAD